MKIYCCGPITGYADYNLPAFDEAEGFLRHLGHEVINPCALDEEGDRGDTWENYLKRDLKLLVDCDAIVLLDGWHKSRGAMLEFYVATNLGLKFYFWDRIVAGHYSGDKRLYALHRE